jgi:hypothetical protein
LTNWEEVVENSGGISGAVSLDVLKPVSVIYIKQDSGRFLQIANERVDLQNGLFVYSPKAVRDGLPYEEMFTGHNSSRASSAHEAPNSQCKEPSSDQPEVDALFQMCGDVLSGFDPSLSIPRMVCLDANKAIAAEVTQHLKVRGVSRESLGLASNDWAYEHYNSFIKTLGL